MEISLKVDDFHHLEKFNTFMKYEKNGVKIQDVEKLHVNVVDGQ